MSFENLVIRILGLFRISIFGFRIFMRRIMKYESFKEDE